MRWSSTGTLNGLVFHENKWGSFYARAKLQAVQEYLSVYVLAVISAGISGARTEISEKENGMEPSSHPSELPSSQTKRCKQAIASSRPKN